MKHKGQWADVLRNRNAMLYSAGQASSQFGSHMTRAALGLYVLHETKSAEQFAAVLAVGFLPQLLLYPLAGALIDRTDRKRLMATLDFVRAGFQLLFCLLFVSGFNGLPIIYIYVLFMACCDSFFNPASNSIVPFLFEKHLFDLANAFSSWVMSGASIAAPALGTAIFGITGLVPILAFDALSFLVGGICTSRLKIGAAPTKSTGGNGFFADIKEGALLLKRKELLFPTLGVAVSRCLVDPVYSLCIPFLLISHFHAPNVSVGITQSSAIIGVLLAPLLVTQLRKRSSVVGNLQLTRSLKVFVFCGFGLSLFILAQTKGELMLAPLVVFSTVCFLGTLVNSAGFAFFNTYLQTSVDRSQLGRFAALRFMLYSAVQPLGLALYGTVLDSRFMFYAALFCILGAIIESLFLAFIPADK